MSRFITPPHMIPSRDNRKDSGWQPEALHDYVPPPGWNPTSGHVDRTPAKSDRGVERTDWNGNPIDDAGNAVEEKTPSNPYNRAPKGERWEF